ncbi:uncharacterized protein J3D65DRAFT_678317 [Phyllosticta citribraziliensis]|uniref:Uncharacterized protein n=1 Tax=Phyllosticta citribraziliensis TaxID=989973 RepID=A0ABR1LJS8_9PEZI
MCHHPFVAWPRDWAVIREDSVPAKLRVFFCSLLLLLCSGNRIVELFNSLSADQAKQTDLPFLDSEIGHLISHHSLVCSLLQASHPVDEQASGPTNQTTIK